MKVIRDETNRIVMYRHWLKWHSRGEYLAEFFPWSILPSKSKK